MPTLRELQLEVMDALLDDGIAPRAVGDAAAASARTRLEPHRARLKLYRRQVRATAAAAVELTYPVLRRLVGTDYFQQIVETYGRLHPSTSGDLNDFGATLADFLRDLHPTGEFRYLADTARFEWLVHEALLAADHEPLDLATLARIDPTDYDGLVFEPHPSLRCYESRFPILEIWRANLATDSTPPLIDLRSGGNRLAILRPGTLEFLSLQRGEYDFLDAITRGLSFAAALQSGARRDPDFDAATALRRCVAARAIVNVRVPS